MWSFPGSFTNRGSGTQLASSDIGAGVHNVLDKALMIPAVGTRILNLSSAYSISPRPCFTMVTKEVE